MNLCYPGEAPGEVIATLAKMLECCAGVILDGPTGCTCWVAEYDVDQAPADATISPAERSKMCDDCAYRPDLPERQGDERYTQPDEDLRTPFWCHEGLRAPARYRHPLGITVAADGDNYDPLIVRIGHQAVPYQADGTPALLCAGWAAHLRALEAADA